MYLFEFRFKCIIKIVYKFHNSEKMGISINEEEEERNQSSKQISHDNDNHKSIEKLGKLF